MAIPQLNTNGELPPGEHVVTLEEVDSTFGRSTSRRRTLITGLKAGAHNLQAAGVRRIWVNGSFITAKENPNDIDGCWEYSANVDIKKLDPVFLSESRAPMKAKYGLEFFPAFVVETESGLPFPKFFQVNRNNEAKGIIVINLGGLS